MSYHSSLCVSLREGSYPSATGWSLPSRGKEFIDGVSRGYEVEDSYDSLPVQETYCLLETKSNIAGDIASP